MLYHYNVFQVPVADDFPMHDFHTPVLHISNKGDAAPHKPVKHKASDYCHQLPNADPYMCHSSNSSRCSIQPKRQLFDETPQYLEVPDIYEDGCGEKFTSKKDLESSQCRKTCCFNNEHMEISESSQCKKDCYLNDREVGRCVKACCLSKGHVEYSESDQCRKDCFYVQGESSQCRKLCSNGHVEGAECSQFRNTLQSGQKKKVRFQSSVAVQADMYVKNNEDCQDGANHKINPICERKKESGEELSTPLSIWQKMVHLSQSKNCSSVKSLSDQLSQQCDKSNEHRVAKSKSSPLGSTDFDKTYLRQNLEGNSQNRVPTHVQKAGGENSAKFQEHTPRSYTPHHLERNSQQLHVRKAGRVNDILKYQEHTPRSDFSAQSSFEFKKPARPPPVKRRTSSAVRQAKPLCTPESLGDGPYRYG